MATKKYGLIFFLIGVIGLALFAVIPQIIYFLVMPLLILLLIGSYLLNKWIPPILMLFSGYYIYADNSWDYQSAPMFYFIETIILVLFIVFLVLAIRKSTGQK